MHEKTLFWSGRKGRLLTSSSLPCDESPLLGIGFLSLIRFWETMTSDVGRERGHHLTIRSSQQNAVRLRSGHFNACGNLHSNVMAVTLVSSLECHLPQKLDTRLQPAVDPPRTRWRCPQSCSLRWIAWFPTKPSPISGRMLTSAGR